MPTVITKVAQNKIISSVLTASNQAKCIYTCTILSNIFQILITYSKSHMTWAVG